MAPLMVHMSAEQSVEWKAARRVVMTARWMVERRVETMAPLMVLLMAGSSADQMVVWKVVTRAALLEI